MFLRELLMVSCGLETQWSFFLPFYFFIIYLNLSNKEYLLSLGYFLSMSFFASILFMCECLNVFHNVGGAIILAIHTLQYKLNWYSLKRVDVENEPPGIVLHKFFSKLYKFTKQENPVCAEILSQRKYHWTQVANCHGSNLSQHWIQYNLQVTQTALWV